MTAQIADSLLWEGTEHEILAVENFWPFSPGEHGFTPVSPHTACWRGYVARYAMSATGLVLRKLIVGLGSGAARPWRGIQPSRDDADEMWEYEGVDLPIPYSGGIVIGTGFRDEFYVHLGFQPAYAFQRVLELELADGRVVSLADRSSGMARIRGIIQQAGSVPSEMLAKLIARVLAGEYEDDRF